MEIIKQYLPFIIPIILIQLCLLAAAIVSILKSTKFKSGNKVIWLVVSICLNLIGPILYFIFGRSDER